VAKTSFKCIVYLVCVCFFCKVYCYSNAYKNIIKSGLLPSGFPTKTLCAHILPLRATCPVHLSLLDSSPELYLVRRTEHKAPHYAVFPTYLLPHPSRAQNNILSTIFSKTLSLHSSLNVSNQVSHPYKTTGKIIVLYTLIFIRLDSKLEQVE
jgi:hypothetical protein